MKYTKYKKMGYIKRASYALFEQDDVSYLSKSASALEDLKQLKMDEKTLQKTV